jgi:phosphatidylglycerol---prolipoprotein diacylglyceryl transferase
VHPVLFHIGPILIPSYGVMTALGILFALALALRTARMADLSPNQIWNLAIIALFAAIVGSRLLLVVVNFAVVRTHPAWLLSLAMIHHPLLSAVDAVLAILAAGFYLRWQKMPLRSTADALAAPLALGLAFEQFGALLAGSGFGTETTPRLGVVYTSPFAALWSGAPLGVPLHPVQAYAGLAFLTLALMLIVWLPNRRQQGDIAGLWLIGTGTAVYFTEFLRDPEGRGSVLRGALDAPQLAAIVLVLVGALVLLQRKAVPPPHASTGVAPTQAAQPSEVPHASEAPHD